MFQRQLLPRWRQHKATELLILRDQIMSSVLIDSGTVFAVRPPELRFIREHKWHFHWFVRDSRSGSCTMEKARQWFKQALCTDYSQSSWIDGTNCDIRLRASALTELIKHISKLTDEDFECEDGDRSL